MDWYRFSVSWPRILPTGDITNVNEKGIEYYNKIIDNLLEQKIEPMITMYHYDLPLRLQQIGGWSNELIVDYFKAYAKLLFERFGDRVKYWVTFNEPYIICRSYGNAQQKLFPTVIQKKTDPFNTCKVPSWDRLQSIGMALEVWNTFYH